MDVGIKGHFVGRPFFALAERELRAIARRAGYRQSRLAMALHLTPRTARRYFRERFGCAPCEWLAEVRLQDAKALLAAGECIKQVALATAFRHVPSFYREFRRWAGCTPAEYSQLTAVTAGREAWPPTRILSESAKPSSLRLLKGVATMRAVRLLPRNFSASPLRLGRAAGMERTVD